MIFKIGEAKPLFGFVSFDFFIKDKKGKKG